MFGLFKFSIVSNYSIAQCTKEEENKRFCLFLFDLLLYVRDKQLRSCRDGQLSKPHCTCASLPVLFTTSTLVYIRSPFTETAPLESAEEEGWSKKYFHGRIRIVYWRNAKYLIKAWPRKISPEVNLDMQSSDSSPGRTKSS